MKLHALANRFVTTATVYLLTALAPHSNAANQIAGTGKATGQLTLDTSDLAHVRANLQLSGTASQVGKFMIEGSGPIEWNGSHYEQIAPASFTVATPAGDQLFGTFTYNLAWVPGRYELSGPAQITGGTGQFFAYTGTADFHATVQAPSGTITDATFTFLLEKLVPGKTVHGVGHAEGQSTLTPPPAGFLSGDPIQIHTVLQGNASHLGKITLELNATGKVVDLKPSPIPPSAMTITLKNGDTLYGTFRWLNREFGFPKYEVFGPFTILGGTGEFENVTGAGTYRGILDVLSGKNTDGTFEFDLLLRY